MPSQKLLPAKNKYKCLLPDNGQRHWPSETIRECLERQFPNKDFSHLPTYLEKLSVYMHGPEESRPKPHGPLVKLESGEMVHQSILDFLDEVWDQIKVTH